MESPAIWRRPRRGEPGYKVADRPLYPGNSRRQYLASERSRKGTFGWRQTAQRIGSGWRIRDWVARG